MRTALLAATKRMPSGALRADAMLAGRSVLAWQIDAATAMGCERFVCFCDAPTDTLLSLQKLVEENGGEFHAIRNNLQLVSLVRADDVLVMFADGLLADRAAAEEFCISENSDPNDPIEINLRKGIATLPAGHALVEVNPEDFERIDRDRHWAGISVMRAGQVHQLADLPPDGDAMSMLLRLALQARVECRPMAETGLTSGRWIVVDDVATLTDREAALIHESGATPSWTSPGKAVATLLTRRIAPKWLDNGPEITAVTGAFFAALGVGLTGIGYGAAGVGVLALAAFGGALSVDWSRLRNRLWGQNETKRYGQWLPALIDGLAILALILAMGMGANPVVTVSMATMAIGVSNLAGASTNDRGKSEQSDLPISLNSMTAFWQDRTTHLAGFALAAGFGHLPEAVAGFGVLALIQMLLRR
ncbi:MAG: hypothetical protein ABJN35_03520 [Erythrobacter sp.]